MTGPLSFVDRANLITDQGGREAKEREGGRKRGEGAATPQSGLTRLSIPDMKY